MRGQDTLEDSTWTTDGSKSSVVVRASWTARVRAGNAVRAACESPRADPAPSAAGRRGPRISTDRSRRCSVTPRERELEDSARVTTRNMGHNESPERRIMRRGPPGPPPGARKGLT